MVKASRTVFSLMFLLVVILGLFLFLADFAKRHYTLEVINPEIIVPISSQTSSPVVVGNATTSLLSATTAPHLLIPEPLATRRYSDIESQKPLTNPPEIIKAIYATGWSAGNSKKINYFIDLIKRTELNAIVIDIKDFSGYILYDIDFDLAKEYNAIDRRIPKINSLIKRLHDENIYVIGRLSVFQDPRLALARPQLALQSSTTKTFWQDKLGLTWIDPAAEEAWKYNIRIAKDAIERGFDEINFDYIRFASDGNIEDIVYPHWNKKISRREVIRRFFEYLRHELPDAVISADLFGLTTVNTDDLGIGQYLEYALHYFDYIAPMVYPSHYHSGFLGFKNPAQYPYEVVKYSLEAALRRLKILAKTVTDSATSTTASTSASAIYATATTTPATTTPKNLARFRPWLQDFDLGADYNSELVRREIQALYDVSSSTPELIPGWMLWNPANIYTADALFSEPRAIDP